MGAAFFGQRIAEERFEGGLYLLADASFAPVAGNLKVWPRVLKGSIDFLTGKQRRAPLWVQKAGLEWLYRLLSDPRRLASRYLIECPKIFYLMFSKRRKS
jgi:UDP-N-acetyl-D-mannosaminuronic acid transferase (WecB/TagA/CpsF family)